MDKTNAWKLAAILLAASKVRREMGVSETTFWRWRRRGWLKTVEIAGRCYVDPEDLEEFRRRARAGDFALSSAGPTQNRGAQ